MILGSHRNLLDRRPIAYPIRFQRHSTQVKPFSGSGFAVVFEDNDQSGFLYVTDERSENVLDALHLYDVNDDARPRSGDQLFIIWNPELEKAGLFYKNLFLAVVDFKNQTACCRSGYPPRTGEWCKSSHEWNDQMTAGLE